MIARDAATAETTAHAIRAPRGDGARPRLRTSLPMALGLLAALLASGCVGIPQAEWDRLAAIEKDWLQPVFVADDRPMELTELQEAAIRRNPALTAAFHRYKAALQDVIIEGSFSDPRVRVSYFIRTMEARTNPPDWRVGVSQEFPFFGKRKLRAEMALHKAHALREELVELRLKIAWETARAFWDLYALDRSAEIVTDQLSILKRLYRSVEAGFRAGTASRADLLAVVMETADRETELANLGRRRREALARLNTLLDRAPGTPLHVHYPLEATAGETALSMPHLDEEPLVEAAKDYGPVRVASHMALRGEAGVALAYLGYFPDVTLGYGFMTSASASMFEAGFNLPIWFGKNRARVEQAKNLWKAEEASRLQAIREAERETVGALQGAKASEALRRLYTERLLPQAGERVKLRELDYAGGRVDLDRVILAERELLSIRLKLADSVATRERMLSRLDYLTAGAVGRLPRARPPGAEDIPEVDRMKTEARPEDIGPGDAARKAWP